MWKQRKWWSGIIFYDRFKNDEYKQIRDENEDPENEKDDTYDIKREENLAL